MRVERARAWAAARSPVEWLVLVAGVLCFGGVGWDAALWEPRLQLLLHLMAVGVIIGIGVAAFTGRIEVPVTRIDVPLLALVAAFALATVSALNVGMSLRALASIVAFALMLPAALIAIRHRPSWVGAIAGASVLVLSIPTLALLLWHRLEWFLAGGPGLPPLRLGGEGTPFGSVAVPPFVIWPAWALAGLVEDPALRRTLRVGLLAVGIPLTILSGSRSAWLAIAVTAVVAGVPWLWSRRHRMRDRLRVTPGGIAIGIGGLVVIGVLLAVVVPRATAVTSLLYRVNLWRDTLSAWATDPLLGIGPGFMPIARQAAAPDFSFPVRQPHSHNLPLGVLGDAGVVGLVAGIALVVVLAAVAGPWRMRSPIGRQAAFVLLGIGVAGLFEDITFEPNFNLLVIGLVAVVLTDAGAVRWTRLPATGWSRAAALALAGVAGVVLVVAMTVSDAGAIAYRTGLDRAADGRWEDATTWMERSIAIDAWHPSGPKALALAAESAGDDQEARAAAADAAAMHPGDAHGWTNLALLCKATGDHSCASAAAERAVATSGFGEADQMNAALLFDALDQQSAADDAYRRSLLSQRLTVFAADPWPRPVSIGDDQLGEDVGDHADLNRLLAWWLLNERIDPTRMDDPAARALAYGILDQRDDADAWIERAIDERPEQLLTWEVATILHDHWGEPAEAARYQRIGEVVRGGPFPDPSSQPQVPVVSWDLATFRGVPRDELIQRAVRMHTSPPFPWALEATLP